jgi:A/G-specific adenine glycosylase
LPSAAIRVRYHGVPRRRTPARGSKAPAEAEGPNARPLTAELATWFAGARRTLPWRAPAGETRDAYRTWLSEIMLQQTRVSVVEEYFRRFLARFPDVHALAAAPEDDVLSLWSGLGYYARGRNLHRAAKVVADVHGGAFPRTARELEQLPGVGSYTASAVASLAFGERTAVVDGNVARVLTRVHADATPIDSPAGRVALAARADALVAAADDPAVHNEAMMELGALVCTPKAPRCGACPWRRACQAHAAGTVLDFPKKAPRRARKVLRVACLVVVAHDHVWLEKRDAKGLFGGLYEPPAQEIGSAETAPAAWTALAAARGLPFPGEWPAPVVVERTLTHRDLELLAVCVDLGDVTVAPHARLVARDAIGTVGTSTAVRALLDAAWPAAQPESKQRGLFS